VTNVVIRDGRAGAVRLDGGEEMRARREVILSGGAVNSPHLLMLSGVGPADQLRRLGIDPLVDAPAVGEGLQDHPICAPQWDTPEVASHLEAAMDPGNLVRWREQRQGPLTSNGPAAGGFGRSRAGLPAPDLGYGVVAAPGPDELLTDPSRRGVSLLVAAVEVASRGRITLRSADPRTPPVIDPAYLSAESDVDVMVAGVRQQREIAALAPLATYVTGEAAPGERLTDDEQLRAWVRRSVTTLFHPTSTCAMGGAGEAACDPELRVRGVDGLRVVDASVMPAAPRGNTNAPTIAVAERAADLIRKG
jgi:choline dehydrogenase